MNSISQGMYAGNILFIPALGHQMGDQSHAVSHTEQVISACKQSCLLKKVFV
jgi:hypothetical protein